MPHPDARTSTRTPKQSLLVLVLFLLVCFVAEAIGGAVTSSKIGTWYATLAKPIWNPPAWIFAPVWSALYFGMAIAAWLIWRQDATTGARVPLTLFGVQLGLNVLWSCIFFGLQSPGLAFAEVIVLWGAVAATMITFWQRSRLAGILFLPYWAWVTFASALNFAFWRLNS
jgi:translocator protein